MAHITLVQFNLYHEVFLLSIYYVQLSEETSVFLENQRANGRGAGGETMLIYSFVL